MSDNNMIDLNEDRDEELHEIKELTIENNKILHSIQRRARLGIAWRIIYWTVILGAAVGAFYFVQPYIDTLKEAYGGVQETQKQLTDLKAGMSWDGLKEYFSGSSAK